MSETRPKYGKNNGNFARIEQKVKITVENKELFHQFIEEHVREWFMNREFGKVEINCKDGIIKICRTDWIS